MDYPNHITNHEKGKHLTYEDYVVYVSSKYWQVFFPLDQVTYPTAAGSTGAGHCQG